MARIDSSHVKYFIVPVAALALFGLIGSANAQSVEPAVELAALNHEVRLNSTAVDHIDRQVNRCETPDAEEVRQLATAANELSQQAAALAYRLPGRLHVRAQNAQNIAETSFWRLMHPPAAEQCYVPPAIS
jgi:hypothetical protein